MLRGAARPLTTGSNGFVCTSCCRRLLRRQTHTATTETSDSWFDAINQISDDFDAKRVRRDTRSKVDDADEKILSKAIKSKESGKTSAQETESKKSAQHAKDARDPKGKASHQHKPATPSSRARPLTVAEKVREAKSRAKWGGMDAIKRTSESLKGRPTHDTLRKADKISPEIVVESASTKRPYGFHPEIEEKDEEKATPEDTTTAETPPRTRKEIRERRKAKRKAKSEVSIHPPIQSESPVQLDSNPFAKSQTLEEALSKKQGSLIRRVQSRQREQTSSPPDTPTTEIEIETIEVGSLKVQPLDIPQPPVPYLQYGLDKVLFNPGIHQLQDPASRVYNFDPYLQKIMPVTEFDFNALKEYKTSSKDTALASLAREHDKKYIGSTSSMTGVLSQFHFLLSSFRPVNLDMLSSGYVTKGTSAKFTVITQAPSAIFLKWKDGSYAIDADKEFDSGNVLMLLGKSMELLLTLPKSDYERYRKSDPRQVPEEQRNAPESYQYSTMGDFLMRSQLDAYDPRLPERGTFDLKTRAVVPVRMDSQNFEPMTGYEIHALHGKWGSYEREYHDMMRATMLKYMLQARMGCMNGIFIAYHNTKRVFGFQYVPIRDMDLALHGQTDPILGDQEFRVSLELLNKILNKATAKFPETSLRIHFETRQEPGATNGLTSLHVFAEPMTEEGIEAIQSKTKAKLEEFERKIMGRESLAPEPESESTETESTNLADGEEVEPNSEDAQPLGESGTGADSPISQQSSSATTSKEADENVNELKPLFYASVLVKSKLNGEYILEDRPTDLSRHDEWAVEYLMQEYEVTRKEWADYEDMKARRHKAFVGEVDEEGQKVGTYIKFLQTLSSQGRRLREDIDSLEAGKTPMLAYEPLPGVREKVEGVDDYLQLLYNREGS